MDRKDGGSRLAQQTKVLLLIWLMQWFIVDPVADRRLNHRWAAAWGPSHPAGVCQHVPCYLPTISYFGHRTAKSQYLLFFAFLIRAKTTFTPDTYKVAEIFVALRSMHKGLKAGLYSLYSARCVIPGDHCRLTSAASATAWILAGVTSVHDCCHKGTRCSAGPFALFQIVATKALIA